MLVMEVFYDLCTDPRALVEIFLNYDCDLYAIDLFKRIVASMAKVSKMAPPRNSAAAGEKGAREEDSLRALGLEGLVAIVSSLHTAARLDDATREAAAARAAPAEVAADVGPESEADREALQTLLLQQQGYHRHHNHPGHHAAAAAAVSPTSSAAAAAGGSKQALSLSLSQHDSSSSSASVSGRDAPPPPPVPPSPSPHSAFDLKKKLQQEVDTGIMKINIKPDIGLAYLASKGHLDAADPRAVAAFFHEHVTRLSKTVVGEYMGRGREDHGGFCVAVLHAYVDLMSFKGLAFDEAIRHYLSGFRLPGEAQKIDRIMEKFAERYCLDNPGVFPNPDTAFILAFSVIMLNTDLHNPAIREDRRMTKAGFIGNSRGISAGGSDLPDDLLGAIFDRIAASPIR
jgi:brefeldin A-inhibited guanine nucleotide-exchange protein